MKSERQAAHYINYLKRAVTRTLAYPFFGMPEGPVKNRIRCAMLSVQNSLPTEFSVNAGDTVVQIGTPWPSTMHRFLKNVTSSGRLVIVEAMPDNQKRLQAEIDRLKLDNVQIIKGAACNENKDGFLSISPYWGDHKIDLNGIRMDNDLALANAEMEQVPVRFLRLDDVLPEIGVQSIDYLSVTVNGAEAEVLRGARTVLAAAAPGARVYAKGHALDDEDKPIHLQAKSIMEDFGYNTKITRGEPSSAQQTAWRQRAGDLYAWKDSEN